MAHDINGPSKLAVREACPGSGNLSLKLPPEESGEAALRGTKLHALATACIRERRAPTVAECSDEDDAGDVDAVVQQALIASADAEEEGAIVLLDQHLDLDFLGIPEGGTVDFAIVKPGDWFIHHEWKFGRTWVPHPDYNRQVQGYDVGLANDYGCTHGVHAVLQPAAQGWAWYREGSAATADLARWRSEISGIVTEAKRPDAPLRPGEHCSLCNNRTQCPALAATAEAAMAAPRSALGAIEALHPADRLAYYTRLGMAAAWIDSARTRIDLGILSGELSVPGLTIGAGRKSRGWVSEDAAVDFLMTKGVEPYVRKVLSVAQAEKALKAKGHKADLGDLVTVSVGNPVVVRDGSGGKIGEP